MARASILLPAVLLALLLLLLPACGGAETGPAPDRPEDWQARSRKQCRLDLPEATHARWDRDGTPELLVCVTPANVEFERGQWKLATEREEERRADLDGFAVALGHHVDPVVRRALRLQIDADTRWTHAMAVLRIALRLPGLDDHLQWNVASHETLRSVHQAVRILTLPEAPPALPTVVIRARPPPGGDDHRVQIELAIGGESVTRVEEDYEGDERAATRAAWDAAAARWGSWIGDARRVRLRIVDEAQDDVRRFVKWSHVVKVLDLLWGHAVRTVDLPGLGVRLELCPPEDLHEDPFVLPDDPVVTPVVVFLATCMVFAAFILTFVPLWLGRSARKRPTRS